MLFLFRVRNFHHTYMQYSICARVCSRQSVKNTEVHKGRDRDLEGVRTPATRLLARDIKNEKAICGERMMYSMQMQRGMCG